MDMKDIAVVGKRGERSKSTGRSKAEQHQWEIRDAPGYFAWIPKENLSVDEAYQRQVGEARVLRIASNWSWAACGAIIVAARDDKLWVIDGQHRVLAAMRHSDVQELPCLVFDTESQRAEASAFFKLNSTNKPMGNFEKFQALLVAGDESALYLKGIFDKNKVNASPHAKGPGSLRCIGSCFSLISLNREVFEQVFEYAATLCADKSPIAEVLLGALWYIHFNVKGGLSDKRLSYRMIEIGPGRLIEGAIKASAYYARGGQKVWARGFLNEVNKGLQKRYVFIGDDDNE